MANLEVESLCTNEKKKKTIDNDVNKVEKCKKIDNLIKNNVYDVSSTAAKESLCNFEYNLYDQIDYVAMGSLLGPALA